VATTKASFIVVARAGAVFWGRRGRVRCVVRGAKDETGKLGIRVEGNYDKCGTILQTIGRLAFR